MQFLRPLLDAVIPAAQAHEKWFVSGPGAYVQPAFFRTANPWTAGVALAVAALSVGGWLVDRWYEKTALYARFEDRIRPLRDHAAGVLAVTAGIMLAFNAWRGTLFGTNFPLAHAPFGAELRLVEAAVGVLLLVGLFTRAAAACLCFLFVPLLAFFPFPTQLELVNLFGVGVFLFYFARGRYSLDWFLGKPIVSTPEQRKVAYVFLRVTLGLAILTLSFWNKWLEPGYHLSLMDRYPSFNPFVLLRGAGLSGLTREQYVFLLFGVETTVGIYEVFGFLTRVAAVLLVPVFVASVVFLPPTELVGHLPILGTLFVLFVYGDPYPQGRAMPAAA